MTEAKYASEVIFTKDTPYLALTGDLFCADLRKSWSRYNGTALYWGLYFLCWYRNIPGEQSQYHFRRCPGSLRHQIISTLQWRNNGAMASQITSLTTVYSTIHSGADQRKHQSSASLAFVCGEFTGDRWIPHKWPITRKMFPFDDVMMNQGVDLVR